MSAPVLFDRRRIRAARARAAAHPATLAALEREIATRLVERLLDVRRRFERVLLLGGATNALGQALGAAGLAPPLLVHADPLPASAALAADLDLLPFAPASFDAVLSAGALHLVDDLPGTLVQLRACLAADGLLLAAMPGSETLVELRWALTQAELDVTGGAAARIAPFVDVRDAGALLQRAGFALPMVDVDRTTLTYADPLALFAELRATGQSGVLAGTRPPLRRAVLGRALQLYGERFALPDGRVPATLELLFLTAWAPAPGQPRPAPRGSGRVDLEGALGRLA